MTRFGIIILLLYIGGIFPCLAQYTFPLSDVVIHPQYARLTGKQQVFLKKGIQTLTINQVSRLALKESFSLLGDPSIKIHGFEFILEEKDSAFTLLRFQDSLRMVKKQLNDISEHVVAIEKHLQTVESHDSRFLSQNNAVSANDRIQWITYMYQTERQGNSTLDSLLFLQENVRAKLTDLTKRVSMLTNLHVTGKVVFTIDVPETGNYPLTLEYLTVGAGWKSSFSINYSSDNQELAIQKKAHVFQETGRDWNNVSISLSDMNPLRPIERPLLYSVYYSYEPKQSEADFYPGSQRIGGVFRDYQPEGEDEVASKQFTAFIKDVKGNLFSDKQVELLKKQLETKISGSYSLATKALPSHTVFLDVLKEEIVTSKSLLFLVPKVDKHTYHIAKILNTPILPDSVSPIPLTLDRRPMGVINYQGQITSDSAFIPLGTIQGITAEYLSEENESEERTYSKYHFTTYTNTILIKNAGSENRTVTVFDQIPVSKESSIEVQLIDADGANFNKWNGKLEWQVALSPNEIKVLRVSYAVKALKGKTLYTK